MRKQSEEIIGAFRAKIKGRPNFIFYPHGFLEITVEFCLLNMLIMDHDDYI